MPNLWVSAGMLDDFLAADYKTGDVLGHWFGPDKQKPWFSYLKGDITLAYSKKVREVKRSFVFLNLGEKSCPAALVVFDRVVSSNPKFKKYWLLHSMEEPAIMGNEVHITLTQRGWSGRLINTTLLPDQSNSQFAKVGGPGREFWVFGQNFASEVGRRHDPDDYELGAWRVELSPAKESETDFFLNVMEVTDRGQNVLPEVEKIENGDLVGARIADRVVLFHRSGERTGKPVSFSVDGAGQFKFLVTDLASGTWQVQLDGLVFVPALPVTAEAGILFFEGPPGKYRLLR